MKTVKVSVFLFAILAMVMASFVFVGHNTKPKNLKEKITSLQLNVDQFSINLQNSFDNSIIEEVYRLCQKQKFGRAKHMIDIAGVDLKEKPEIRFLNAICLFNNKNLAEAETEFIALQEGGHPFMQDQINWCLAIMHLKQNKIHEAHPYLEVLAGQPNADFHIEACTLLKELGLSNSLVAI